MITTIALAILNVATPAAPACGPLYQWVAVLSEQFHETEVSRAREDRGVMVITFASPSRTWTALAVGPDLTACLFATGTDYYGVTP